MRARKKEVVLLTGASGSMGFEAFRLLWGMRKRYDIVLLLRPSRRNRIKFKPYEHQAGIVAEPDASIAPDVERAVAGE